MHVLSNLRYMHVYTYSYDELWFPLNSIDHRPMTRKATGTFKRFFIRTESLIDALFRRLLLLNVFEKQTA